MKPLNTLLVTAALLAGTSTAALAQVDLNVDAGADVGAELGQDDSQEDGNNGVGVGVGGNANGNANANALDNAGNAAGNAAAGAMGAADGMTNYGAIISSLQAESVTAADIEGLTGDAGVEIVTMSELRGNAAENASALDEALTGQDAMVGDLVGAVEANAELAAQLEAEGFTAADIAAVTRVDGTIIILVDDEA